MKQHERTFYVDNMLAPVTVFIPKRTEIPKRTRNTEIYRKMAFRYSLTCLRCYLKNFGTGIEKVRYID